MALNYTIMVIQTSNTRTESGRIQNIHELSDVIKEMTKDNVHGEKAIVKITCTEVTQAQLDYEERLKALGLKEDE